MHAVECFTYFAILFFVTDSLEILPTFNCYAWSYLHVSVLLVKVLLAFGENNKCYKVSFPLHLNSETVQYFMLMLI